MEKKTNEGHCNAYSSNRWLKQQYSPCRTKFILKRPDPATTQNAGVVAVSICLVPEWINIFCCSGHGKYESWCVVNGCMEWHKNTDEGWVFEHLPRAQGLRTKKVRVKSSDNPEIEDTM